MTNSININELAGALKGSVRLDIYEGDIQRERISIHQRAWNLFADTRWKLFRIPASHYYWGEIKNKHVQTIEKDNLILTLGKQLLMDRLFGLSAVAAMSHMGVGTDSTAAVVGQNKLNPTVAGSVDFNVFDATPIRTSLTVAAITTWGTGDGNFIWNEMGIANSATNDGTHLFNRLIIGPITKSAALSIIVTYSLTQS